MQRRTGHPDRGRDLDHRRARQHRPNRIQTLLHHRQHDQRQSRPPRVPTPRGDVDLRLAETDHCRASPGKHVSHISRHRTSCCCQQLPSVALVDQGRARPCGRRGAPSSDGAATRCYPILRATATTPTSRPRAPVTDRTTRHHGRYRWNPSPDARECAPSHRRRPGAARSFRPPPHPSTGPFHSRKESRSRKHLAADPWTPPPSRLVSASIG
jgi:hypothetical protein